MVRGWIIAFLPGFLIALLIGLSRPSGRVRLVRLLLISAGVGAAGAVLSFGALMALFSYSMRTVIADHAGTPLTVEEARQADCPIALPDTATHIQFEQASGGLIALEILVRFQAPASVCRAEAVTVIHNEDQLMRLPPKDVMLAPIRETPRAEDGDMVGRAAWFDVEAISNGVTASNNNVQCWIDDDRGVFFCKITD